MNAVPEHARFAVNLDLRGRPCLVVGAGEIAYRKIEGLLTAGASVHVIADVVGAGVAKLIDDGAITCETRRVEIGDVSGYWFVTVATSDPSVNRAVFEDGERNRVFVNAADDPRSCSATLPAVVRRGRVSFAVSTSGGSPALATWLKGRIGDQFGDECERLAALLSEVRQDIKASGRSTEGLAWQAALDDGLLELVRDGYIDEAKSRLREYLTIPSDLVGIAR